jgi:phosphoglycolate phosphatase-like HAD superfamily hydrolase
MSLDIFSQIETQVIFFDFDGVILDSMDIREDGYRNIFLNHDPKLVQKLIDFHYENGGISRFYKIRYFHESILKTKISEDEVKRLAESMSHCMRTQLNDKSRLIDDSMNFIKNNYEKFDIHIVSGSEKEELHWVCEQLEIKKYFKSLEGSPTPKPDLLENIIKIWKYKPENCVLIGDSINDYDAAEINGIKFYGFNNLELRKTTPYYIDSFLNLPLSS